MNPTCIGLDLSLTAAGIASSAGWCAIEGAPDITTKALPDRLDAVDELVDNILILVGRNADLICIEIPAFSRAGGGTLERSALWWMVVRRLRLAGTPIAEVPIQARMRYATGKGAASKGAIIDAVARRWPQFETDGNDNLADAAVLAAIGADQLGVPLAAMPQTHRKALDIVRWPEEALEAHEHVQPPTADAWAQVGT